MANRKQEIDSQGKIVRGEYNASLPTYGDGAVVTPQYDSSGRIITSPVDVEIGAVELKDGSSDVRATINAANTARTTATTVVVTEPIDGEGHVVDWSDLDDIKTAVQIIDNAIAGNEMQVDIITMPTVAVTGTFWQATQPVSIAATVTVDSELPAAAALADTTANPTIPAVAAYLMGFDGTNWYRNRLTAGDGDGVGVTNYAILVNSIPRIFNSAGNVWDRARQVEN